MSFCYIEFKNKHLKIISYICMIQFKTPCFKFCRLLIFVSKLSFSRNLLQIIKQFESRSGPINIGPDLDGNCLQWLSADDKRYHKYKCIYVKRVLFQCRMRAETTRSARVSAQSEQNLPVLDLLWNVHINEQGGSDQTMVSVCLRHSGFFSSS